MHPVTQRPAGHPVQQRRLFPRTPFQQHCYCQQVARDRFVVLFPATAHSAPADSSVRVTAARRFAKLQPTLGEAARVRRCAGWYYTPLTPGSEMLGRDDAEVVGAKGNLAGAAASDTDQGLHQPSQPGVCATARWSRSGRCSRVQGRRSGRGAGPDRPPRCRNRRSRRSRRDRAVQDAGHLRAPMAVSGQCHAGGDTDQVEAGVGGVAVDHRMPGPSQRQRPIASAFKITGASTLAGAGAVVPGRGTAASSLASALANASDRSAAGGRLASMAPPISSMRRSSSRQRGQADKCTVSTRPCSGGKLPGPRQ